MKPGEKRIEQALGLFSTPSPEQMESAREYVLQRLESSSSVGSQVVMQAAPAPSSWKRWSAFAAVAAAITIAVVLVLRSGAPAVLETSDGSKRIDFDEALRSNGGPGEVLTLADGSRVEMRAESELSLERAEDGVRIRLSKGVIIVNAAKQGTGHLYVQTHDVTVAVVGTVFLVNAEEEGSRVAVIEGEVRVERGAATKNLLPGEQLSTNPQMKSLPVKEEVSWSRNAEAHVALLEQSAGIATAPKLPAFTAVSIRPAVTTRGPLGASIPDGPLGSGCHGSDGNTRFGGGVFVVPQGRCVFGGVSLAVVMNYAYGVPWRYGANVPEWASAEAGLRSNLEYFHIEAVADNPSTTTTAQLRQMLQTMLADRFKLRVHREQQELQGYALRIAKDGIKIKEASGDIELPLGMIPIKGKSSLDDFSRFLTEFFLGFANLGFLDTPVVNKTGLTGIYAYEFRLRPGGGGQRGADAAAGPPSRSQRAADVASNISTIIEDELGLRLQAEKVTTEVIVIDQVEKPSPN